MNPVLIYYKENVFSQLNIFQNLRLATSGRTVDEKFYRTFEELETKEDVPAIFIMNTLSDNAIELQGLQMAHYIRIITRGERIGKLPIFLIGTESIEELLRLSDYASILQTPAVELLPYSKEKVMQTVNNIQSYKHLVNYEAYLQKSHIPKPDNHPSHHSVTSEWSLYQWSKCLNIKTKISIHIESNLYYRYIISQHPHSNDIVTIDYPKYSLEPGKKRILIIDDETDKGWGELYRTLFSHYPNIEVNTLKDFDYSSGTEEGLVQEVRNTLTKDTFSPYHLVLLDIRLLQNDLKKKSNFSSFAVISMLQTQNKGIQIIIVTASNKVWNLQHSLNNDIFAYITKESVFDESCSKEKLEELLKQSLAAISKSDFLQNAVKREKIILEALEKKMKETNIGSIRKRMLHTIKEQIEIAWVMLTNYRFNEKYLRYAYLSYYQILELFVETEPGMYIKIDNTKEIHCEDINGKDINCSEKLKMKYDDTRKGYLIQITRNERGEKALELGSYARIGSWMYARIPKSDFTTWLDLNTARNNNAHGGISTTNIDLEKKLIKIMSLIIDFVSQA